MPPARLPSQRQRLAEALRGLRADSRLSTYELADRLSRELGRQVSQSKISRIERGRSPATAEEVQAWARATGASPELQALLVERAELAGSESIRWRSRDADGMAKQQGEASEDEASAHTILQFEVAAVPALLQVADYARRMCLLANTPDVPGSLAARMQRQTILADENKRFEFLIAEAGLRWRIAPINVMLAQLRHMASVMTLPNVELGIIPFDQEAVDVLLHGFVIYQGPEDETKVSAETWASELSVANPDHVKVYTEAFEQLRSAALFGDDARALLDRVAGDLRQQ
jgi:transcriptional regulator with XRE-family HTH domain